MLLPSNSFNPHAFKSVDAASRWEYKNHSWKAQKPTIVDGTPWIGPVSYFILSPSPLPSFFPLFSFVGLGLDCGYPSLLRRRVMSVRAIIWVIHNINLALQHPISFIHHTSRPFESHSWYFPLVSILELHSPNSIPFLIKSWKSYNSCY